MKKYENQNKMKYRFGTINNYVWDLRKLIFNNENLGKTTNINKSSFFKYIFHFFKNRSKIDFDYRPR